jgi:hypothetical protein
MAKSQVNQVVAIAQELQVRRETYRETLESLPVPQGPKVDFPYASMEAAIDDDFALIGKGGAEEAFKFLVKGYKTAMWRKAAEHNRVTRDEAADGEVPEVVKPEPKKRARKTAAEKDELKAVVEQAAKNLEA